MKGRSYNPHEFQKVFHTCTARFRGMVCGRQGGKSFSGDIENIYWLDRGRCINCGTITSRTERGELICPKCEKANVFRPVTGLLLAPTVDDVLTIHAKMLLDWIPDYAIDSWNVSRKVLKLKNGSELLLRSEDDPANVGRGLTLDFIHFDEARKYKDFKVAWETLMPTLAVRKGSAWATTTTNGIDAAYSVFKNAKHIYAPLNQMSLERQKPVYTINPNGDDDYAFITYRSFDNPLITIEEVMNAKKNMNEQYWRQEYFATIEKFSGLVYPDFDNSIHIVDENTIRDLVGVQYFIGVDVGYTNPTAIILIAEDSNHSLYVIDEFYKTQQTAADIANEIKRMSLGRKIQAVIIDPASRGRQQTSEMSMYDQILECAGDIPLEPGNNDVMAGINRITQLIKNSIENQNKNPDERLPGLYVAKWCTNTRGEMAAYVWEQKRGDINEKERPKKFRDHLLDAKRYVAMSRPDWYDRPLLNPYTGREIEYAGDIVDFESNDSDRYIPL